MALTQSENRETRQDKGSENDLLYIDFYLLSFNDSQSSLDVREWFFGCENGLAHVLLMKITSCLA